MNLLTARTTAVSYPTDAALQKRLLVPGVPVGQSIGVRIHALPASPTASLGTTPVLGVVESPDNGTNWGAAFMEVSDTVPSPLFYLTNGNMIRPTFATGGGSPEVNLVLTPVVC